MIFTPDTARRLPRDEVNRRMKQDADAFVREECARYLDEVEAAARWLHDERVQRRVLLLSGPSSAGKTTTANLLRTRLQQAGTETHVVSLDNFYLGRGQAPRLPDGSLDYESPEALNLPLLTACVRGLLEDGYAALPEYDFQAGTPRPERVELRLQSRSVVIFEGIHALHPYLREHLPRHHVKRLLVGTQSAFFDGDRSWLDGRRLRLVRRLVRDERHRSSSASNTLSMWPQVVRGEEMYLLPYAGEADRVIDTTHAFEPCMLAPRLLPLLRTVAPSDPHYATAQALRETMEVFDAADSRLLPPESLLHEFLS